MAIERKSNWTRRGLIAGGTTVASLGALGTFVYSRFGGFIRQFNIERKLPIVTPKFIPNPQAWPDKGLHAAWLGHSTVLMKVDGFTILTDPVFGDRAGLDLYLFTLGLKRVVAPALDIKKLPHIDLILSSHAHMDHLDTPSMRALENKKTEVLMATQTSDIIRARRYAKVTEMNWGESARVGPAQVKAFEVNHWGARMRTDTYRGYNGYLIEVNNRRILFAGDTAITDTFRELRTHKGIDLAIMPIGAYNPWIRVHCNPEQAWRMGNEGGAEHFLPVHHSTFRLSQEPALEPIERFYKAAGSSTDRIVLSQIGAECHFG